MTAVVIVVESGNKVAVKQIGKTRVPFVEYWAGRVGVVAVGQEVEVVARSRVPKSVVARG